jgi:hypothetical protein
MTPEQFPLKYASWNTNNEEHDKWVSLQRDEKVVPLYKSVNNLPIFVSRESFYESTSPYLHVTKA